MKATLTKLFVLFLASAVLTTPLYAEPLDELSLARWKELREAERYQLNIAEKYYREKNYKVALPEYEKFLTLYEQSEGAAYSQLKWSLCQLELRKQNTAIKEGFQSILDYWPDSPEAIAAAYYIGHAYKDMGEVAKAKKAHQVVLEKHPKHLAAVYATVDLIDITAIDEDVEARVKLWGRLAFDTERTRESTNHCVSASQQLAAHLFEYGSFDEAVKSLATTYPADQLVVQVSNFSRAPVSRLTSKDETRSKGEQLADQGVAWIRQQIPADRSTAEAKQAALLDWYAVADLQAASRREAKVLETYEQILKSFGPNDSTLQRLGDWYKSIGQYDPARGQYAKFENKIEAQNQIAYSYRQQQNYDAAVQAYQRNVAADPDNQSRWSSEVANAYREARKYDQAIAVYNELMKSDSAKAEQWLWLIAASYRDSGRYKEAIGYYRQCNNFPSNYQEMAACHRALKEYGEAVIMYSQIVGGAPNSAPWAMLQIGYTQEQAGNKEAAIKAFQQVCKNFPKDGHASQAHAHLQTEYKITVTLGGAKDE
ncbi:MAG: tetratricopeptide repeat protein [Planctomycetota bacterium]|nr:tetratricopeptide repeat protein [Planctomycetota bacterium]